MSILLSVSVPDYGTDFHNNCDQMLIQASMRTFLFTAIGKKHVVFGGHSSIACLILAVCEDKGVKDGFAVTIYYPEEDGNPAPADWQHLATFIPVPAGENIAEVMASSHPYEAGVFIGGQEDILDAHKRFVRHQPQAKILAPRSPGGAAATIEPAVHSKYDELMDYVGLFTKELGVDITTK